MKRLKPYLMPVTILILSGIVLHDHLSLRRGSTPAPAPAAAVDGTKLGKAYAPVLLSTYGDAWLAAAKTLEAGKPVAEAQKTLQETWKASRVKAFTDHVAPHFALVLPEGTEPADAGKRAQVVTLWRDFARGLKGGH